MQKISEPLHPDFQKILQQFIKRYGEEKGKQYFYAWVNQLGLDDTKPYVQSQEKFQWARGHFQYIKQDKLARYYEVEAAFPLTSMNLTVYTEHELERAARTLVGKPVNINHESHTLKGVTIEDAEYEDGAVECLLRVLNNAGHGLDLNIQSMIEQGDIVNVSIEASCTRGLKSSPEGDVCVGLNFTGLALLTKDALPGIPLTRIMPVEAIVESYHVSEVDKMKKEEVKSETEKLATLEFQVSELKRKFQQSKEEAELAQSHLEIKEKAYNDLQVSHGELERHVDTLKAKLEQLKETHENLLKQHSELTAAHTKLRGKHEELLEEHKSLVEESEHTSQLLAEEQKAHYDASSEKIQLTQDLTDRNNEILELKTQIQGLNVQVTEKTREITRLQEQNKDLFERLKKAKRLGKIVVKV
jgi:hypothetical protein